MGVGIRFSDHALGKSGRSGLGLNCWKPVLKYTGTSIVLVDGEVSSVFYFFLWLIKMHPSIHLIKPRLGVL